MDPGSIQYSPRGCRPPARNAGQTPPAYLWDTKAFPFVVTPFCFWGMQESVPYTVITVVEHDVRPFCS